MPMIGGKNYTEQQIADFYANGGNDVQFAQQNGLGREDIISARQYAGGNTPNAQTFFNQYKAANPNGAYANNFAGWQNDLGTHTRDAMNSGTYTGNGADQSPTDYFNAYQAGQGGMGWQGGGGAQGGGQNLGMGGGPGQWASGNSGGGGGQSSMAGGSNPYLQGMGQSIVDQMTDNFTRNQLPSMRAGARAAGAVGSARQGVVEANGLNDLNRGIGQNLTNLYGQDWTNSKNRDLQQQSINNSYDLGLKSNDLGYANLDSGNQRFGQTFGLDLLNAQNNWSQQGVQTANGIQNAPIDYARYFNGQANQTGGMGGTSTNSQTNQGNPWVGAIGGAQLANSWFK